MTDYAISDKTAMGDKPARYAAIARELASLVEEETDLIANMANCAALVYHALPDLNWVGFYLLRGKDLVLGPFQGRPACVRIPLGKGVCGAAAESRQTIVVPDVDQFPGHIACDVASRSEIVVPLLTDARLIGVFDLDSPRLNRFDADDRAGLESLVAILLRASSG
jgi:GAF domain-containing protein